MNGTKVELAMRVLKVLVVLIYFEQKGWFLYLPFPTTYSYKANGVWERLAQNGDLCGHSHKFKHHTNIAIWEGEPLLSS